MLPPMDAKQLTLLLTLVFGGSAGGSIVNSLVNPPRPDPFTGAMAAGMEARIVAQLEQTRALLRLEAIQQEMSIRADMPPGPTRERLRAIERWAESRDPDFTPPTTRFSAHGSRSR